MGIETFDQLEELFYEKEVKQIYVKFLPDSQDNDKNQIYLGNGLDGVSNLFPSDLHIGSGSESTKKRRSSKGRPKLEAILEFYWMDSFRRVCRAPHAKIIDYFQYPEVRFSGFLKGCSNPPDSLRRINQDKYGKRILVVGANDYGKTFGIVLTELEDPITLDFPELPQSEAVTIFKTHTIGSLLGLSQLELLKQELIKISGIWHPSTTLRPVDTQPIPFKGNQGAGFTLEALFNIPRNSEKKPDKYGFEIKSFKQSGKISLMTPTADCGKEGEMSFKEFMNNYGWIGKKGDGRIVFNGIYRYKIPNKSNGYVLDILGYDKEYERFSDETNQIVVGLLESIEELLLSGWSFQKLLDCWSKKHVSACYVEYLKRPYQGPLTVHDFEYKYTGKVYFGMGTTIFKYLKAIASGIVYYDPAHEILANGKPHTRPQWRISVTKTKMLENLKHLYNTVTEMQLV